MTVESVTCTVNGQTFTRSVEARRHLADFLRHDLGLTGTHPTLIQRAVSEQRSGKRPKRKAPASRLGLHSSR
jgi:hypothetical protein